jgi:hypothetical protein
MRSFVRDAGATETTFRETFFESVASTAHDIVLFLSHTLYNNTTASTASELQRQHPQHPNRPTNQPAQRVLPATRTNPTNLFLREGDDLQTLFRKGSNQVTEF